VRKGTNSFPAGARSIERVSSPSGFREKNIRAFVPASVFRSSRDARRKPSGAISTSNVALMPVDVADAELKRRDAQGFRGVRFHYMEHLGKGAPIDEVIQFAGRLAEIGWHLQIHMAADRIGELTPALKRSPVPVVIDHMGRIDASRGLEQEPFRNLLSLMADRKVWVKLSGADRATRQGPPYSDAAPFARKLVEEFGDRCVWGTDFPHPNHDGPIPDDGVLVDWLAQIAPKAAQLQALLVENPQRLYRFGKLGPATEA